MTLYMLTWSKEAPPFVREQYHVGRATGMCYPYFTEEKTDTQWEKTVEAQLVTKNYAEIVAPSVTVTHCLFKISSLNYLWGFPGGAVVENPPANAGDMGSSPGLRWSHMPRSNWAREPQLLSLRVWSLCSATREATIVRGPCNAMKGGPRLPQLEKALAQKRRHNTAINK